MFSLLQCFQIEALHFVRDPFYNMNDTCNAELHHCDRAIFTITKQADFLYINNCLIGNVIFLIKNIHRILNCGHLFFACKITCGIELQYSMKVIYVFMSNFFRMSVQIVSSSSKMFTLKLPCLACNILQNIYLHLVHFNI